MTATTPSQARALTRGERRIAELVHHDLSNRQIAEQLDISTTAVGVSLAKLYRKLQVRRVGLALLVERQQIGVQ